MGKVIKTKDGRTLMKGPDGRWMSAGGKATQSKKNKEFSQKMFEENLQRREARNNDPSNPSVYLAESARKYKENPMITAQEGWSQAYLNEVRNYMKSQEKKTIRDATKIAELKNQYKLSDEAVEELMKNHGGNVDLMEKSLASAQKIVDKHGSKKPFRRGHAINQKTPRNATKPVEKSRDSKNMLKEYQKAYQNQLSSSAEKRMKELEEQADKMGYEIKMTNYSAQAQKNSLASPQFELVKKTEKKASIANLKAANTDVKRAAQDEAFKQHGISRDQVVSALKAKGLDTASAERQASSMAVADAKKLVKQKVSTAIGTPAKIAIDVNGEKIKPKSASSGGFYSRGVYDLSNHKLSQNEIDDLIDKMGMTDITWQRPGVGIKGTNTASNTKDGDELQLGIKFLATNGKKAASNIRVWKRDGKYIIPGYTGKGSYDSQEEAILAAKKYLKSDYKDWWNNGYIN